LENGEESDEEVIEDYDVYNPNTVVDKKLAKELGEAREKKLADGVKMVEYDAFGLPKSREMEKLKQELKLDETMMETEGTIIPPSENVLHGHRLDVDIEEKDKDDDVREVDEMFDDAEEAELDVIDEDFILSLNQGEAGIVEGNDEGLNEPIEAKNGLPGIKTMIPGGPQDDMMPPPLPEGFLPPGMDEETM